MVLVVMVMLLRDARSSARRAQSDSERPSVSAAVCHAARWAGSALSISVVV
jgi:hypothetical protein